MPVTQRGRVSVRHGRYVALVIGAISELDVVELSEVEEIVGSRSFERGGGYARRNRVARIKWDADAETLTGSVVGQGALYSTTAYFAADGDGGVAFEEGECSCPVGHNCKHVAAIVIAATGTAGVGPRRPAPRAARKVAVAPKPLPSWEQPLRQLIGAPEAQATGTPLAIELGLQAKGPSLQGTPRLWARLMRPAARGGWVNGSLAWSGLDSWHVQSGGYRADHVALMRELYAIRHARERASAYYYRPTGDRTLDLGGCDSPQLWSLLDEADRLGLELVHARPGLGDLPRYVRGELALDVSRRDDAALVSAVIRVKGAHDRDLEPVLFLGSGGHGVVCVEPGDETSGDGLERRRLQLVRLAKPAPAELRRMILDGDQLEIPAGDLDRFAEEFFPALRHLAPIVSSDGSFTGPEISAPTLVLRLDYGADLGMQAGWEWAYQVGSTTRRAAVGAGGPPGFRDLEAESAILAGAVLAETGLGGYGLLDLAGRPGRGPTVSLTVIDAMRLTTEALPRLAQRDDIAVDVGGVTPDYRDVGESLAIGLSTADVAEDRDWFDLGVTISVEGRELSFTDVFTALASGESWMMLDDGAHFSLLEPRLQSLRRLIDEARALSDSPASPLRISRYQAGLWAELVALGTVNEQAAAWQRQAAALLEFDAGAEHQPPATLTARLRAYQREGFCWLASLWEFELGGILADDMGLGKTLQALALICHARGRDPDIGPFLVVAPTSVVSNWIDEAARFAPGLRVAAITDTMAKSGRTLHEILAGADVVVTTYTLLRLEADAYRTPSWAGVMLDEAQYAKNHRSSTYHAIRQLEAPFKLAITGTPMENNLMELWSLLSITAPGLFPDPNRFAEHYARPIERRSDAEQLALLRRRIRPLVKRRTKELVAGDLPAKQEQTLSVDLHPRHRKHYDRQLQRERQKILGLIDDFDRNRFTILRSIMLLRQLSLHAGLVGERHGAVPCAKLGALVEQLEDVVGGGHRALVFSQFTGFLAKVRDRLDQEGIDYCYLDGQTRRRDRVIDRFKTGADPVFLLSLKAGGVGLNLTEADYCFLLDPWWNPATEAQAIDRTHRIGQTRPVMVYRIIARGTIEEKVVALARRKAELFRGVMDDGDLFASSLTAEDVRGLFD